MRTKRLLALMGLAGAVAILSAATTFTMMRSTMTIARIGGFYTSSLAFDSLQGGQEGGQVRFAIVGGSTDTLRVGDVVYWSDTNKVTKSATLANYNRIAGVVVGGIRATPPMSAWIDSADVGTAAATSGQRVVILKQGRTWMRSGQNAAQIPGRLVLPSDSIAGRFDTVLTAAVIDTFHRTIGRTIKANAALGITLVDVNIK